MGGSSWKRERWWAAASLVESRGYLLQRDLLLTPQSCWKKKNPFPNHKGKLFEAGIPLDCRLSPAFCERPSIFIAINSVKVGFTKENGGNHLVICSSAETSLSISVPSWTRGPGLLCCLCQELNIAICNCVSQRQASQANRTRPFTDESGPSPDYASSPSLGLLLKHARSL